MLFRLSTGIVIALTLTASTCQAQGPVVPEKDKVAVRNYTLTMDKVTSFFVTLSAITQATQMDPQLKKESDANTATYDAQPGVDKMSEFVSKSPKILAICRSHGFTSRSFALTEFSVFQTMAAVDALATGTSMADMIASGEANVANINLFMAHKAEIEALKKKYPL